MTSASSVSVILPVFNGQAYLGKAIESVLDQTDPPLEAIVVDDGSTDESARVARQFEPAVRYIHQANAGPAAARNRGLQETKGDFIAFLDADDFWSVDHLACHAKLFADHPDADITQGLIQCVKPDPAHTSVTEMQPHNQPWKGYLLGSLVIRHTAFERVGMFNSEIRLGEDLEWFLRAVDQGLHIVASDQVSLWYRIHAGNMTRDLSPDDLGILNIIKWRLDRRRMADGATPRI